MEWERAKTYILLFFVLLNLFLGGLLLMERRRYSITPEREQAIVTIMYRNNITMDTRIQRRFTPMRIMYVSGFYYNEQDLREIFFGDARVVRMSTQRGYVLSYEQGRLEIDHGFISYDNPMGHGGEDAWLTNLSQNVAESLADNFVQAHWTDFILDDIVEGPDWFNLTFRQVYRGYMIHTNFIEILVTERGIIRVEMQFGQVLGMGSERHMIAAPDEVLLTFVQRVRLHAMVSPVSVIHMDLVYLQEEGSPDPEGRYLLEPFYRVFIYGNEGNPFLINAVTNEIIN